MQRRALASLQTLRNRGETKALIISATGTGKTFLAAFDARTLNPRRLLFVIHRENIAKKAMDSFRHIFGRSRTYGLYTGNEVRTDADFVFSTVQTLSRPKRMNVFRPDHFDYIIVDESHRSGADSYARFLDYFRPKFLLGMTATPERTDGRDIFKFFDHNIGYEIRLQHALEEEMLCPFHYYGVSDMTVDGDLVEQHADFNRLLAPERVARIIEKAELYGCYDNVLRGLVFCSRVDEATQLSEAFNRRGFRTIALSGSNSEDDRERAIQALESHEPDLKLDYIFTVDIFNEGVDIPAVNQIIMLRPTQSAIVFVQQLGRGLRKVDDADRYLTVIDFIGNYQNNYLIPIALYGDRTRDKDRIRRLVVGESEGIAGTSTVSFDRITKERIFESINTAKLQVKRDLVADYDALKFRIGHIPKMMDFLHQGSRDPSTFADYSKSFYNFVSEREPDEVGSLGLMEREILEVFAKDALNGRTYFDPVIVGALLSDKTLTVDDLKQRFVDRTGLSASDGYIESAARSINLRFLRRNVNGALRTSGERWSIKLMELHDGVISRTPQFDELLGNATFREFLADAAAYATERFLDDLDPSLFINGFVRYGKYSRADVFKILGFDQNPVAQNVGGYMVAPDKSSCPIFVTYHKSDSIADTTKYEDAFKNPGCMHYFSKSNRTLASPDVQYFRNVRPHQRLPLFVQKNNDEGIEFYYLGDVRPDLDTVSQDVMPSGNGRTVPVVRMDLVLDHPVEASLYHYLVG